MSESRKIHCPHFGFLETSKKGKGAGYSHYYCKNCDSYLTDCRPILAPKIARKLKILSYICKECHWYLAPKMLQQI